MPELPEVETMRALLAARLEGSYVTGSEFVETAILKYPAPAEFEKSVTGKRITSIGRRSKFLRFYLESRQKTGESPDERLELFVHLKMRGMLRVEPEQTAPQKYLCAQLAIDGGRRLRYYDMWRWGGWWLVPEGAASDLIPGFRTLGPDPLDAEFSLETFRSKLNSRRGALKPLLLAQEVVAGLGNIYCDECLNRAGIHPARSAESLSHHEIDRLHGSIVHVIGEAVAQGGAYANRLSATDGNLDDFNAIYRPRVYDNPGAPCPVCGEALVKFHLRGRGTTICPHCQPDADTILVRTPNKKPR